MLLITLLKMESHLKLNSLKQAPTSLFKTRSYPGKKQLRSKAVFNPSEHGLSAHQASSRSLIYSQVYLVTIKIAVLL